MALTATDAAAALQDIGQYEERLTMRAAGLTHMIWGFVTAGLFMTYALAESMLRGADQAWLGALWAPWVGAGIFVTKSIWDHHALSLHREGDGSIRFSLILTVAFLSIGAALFLGGGAAGFTWGQSSLIAVANGLFATGLGWMHRRQGGPTDLSIAGLLMLLIGIALAWLDLSAGAAAGIAAGGIGGAWFVSGAITYQRG